MSMLDILKVGIQGFQLIKTVELVVFGDEVTEHGCFQSRGGPQIIHFNRGFHYKPSILGYQYFWFNTHMGHMGGWNGNMEMK